MDKIYQQLVHNLHTKKIDVNQFFKALDQYGDLIEKAGGKKGEGSKGGHVIGHTKSGKPVYKHEGAGSHKYKEFTDEDHADASHLHNQLYSEHSNKRGGPHHQYESGMASHHGEARDQHRAASIQVHKKSLSDGDKKILADQKKKQINEHNDALKAWTEHHAKVKSPEEKEHAQRWIDHHKSQKERLEKE